MNSCECCGVTDLQICEQDIEDDGVCWYLYCDCEVTLCSRCAKKLKAKLIEL